MKSFRKILGIVSLATALTTQAQVIDPSLGKPKNLVYLSVGFDQALLNPVLGYGRGITIGATGRVLLLTAEVSLPPTGYGLRNQRYRLGAHLNLIEAGRFVLPLKIESSLSYGRNAAYDAVNYSSALTLAPVLRAGRWAVGVEGYYQHGWATRLTNRPAYRLNYPLAQDGWYQNPSGTLRGGLTTGYQLGCNELTLRVGYQQNGAFDTYLPPYYGSIGLVRRFGD